MAQAVVSAKPVIRSADFIFRAQEAVDRLECELELIEKTRQYWEILARVVFIGLGSSDYERERSWKIFGRKYPGVHKKNQAF